MAKPMSTPTEAEVQGAQAHVDRIIARMGSDAAYITQVQTAPAETLAAAGLPGWAIADFEAALAAHHADVAGHGVRELSAFARYVLTSLSTVAFGMSTN